MPNATMERDELFVGGAWVAPVDKGRIDIISPETEQVVGHGPEGSAADIDNAVSAARKAMDGEWSRSTAEQRAAILDAAADLLDARAEEINQILIDSIACPVMFAAPLQTAAASGQLRFFAEQARTFSFEEVRSDARGTSVVRFEPVGVVAAIIPWNAPVMEALIKIAPALAAGCTVVLKPSPEEPLTSLVLAEIFEAAGLPEGVLSVVPGGREVGEHLVRHPEIDKVAFTGSSASGQRIMEACAARMTRISLELGGKSAGILLDDVDIATQVPRIVMGSMLLSGQICAAQTRLLVPASRYDEITEVICATARSLSVGAAADPTTMVGPLVASRQRDRVEEYIAIGQQEGAKVAVGGGRPEGLTSGWYVEPTIFVDVDNSMRIAQEEIFGPVISVIRYTDDEDAIRIANDSEYGLSGGIWTSNPARGLEMARRIRTGSLLVNAAPPAADNPFGGYKRSGIGREMGQEGFKAYLETKSITVPAGTV